MKHSENNFCEDVIKSRMCIGCGLCVSKDDSSLEVIDGFLVPRKPINDDISKHCPGFSVTNFDTDKSTWGSVRTSQIVASKDKSLRFKSASGGGISQLIITLLDLNFVDRVIATIPSEDNPLINKTSIFESSKDVNQLCASRYNPSSPLDVIRDILEDRYSYAFIGRPCDISALKSLIKGNPAYDKKIKLLVSFFCGGTPSTSGTLELAQTYCDSLDLEFIRYRGNGWPGKTMIKTESKKKYIDYEYAWGSVLNKHLHNRCKVCSDSIGVNADIVFADAWNIKKNKIDLTESEGKSLMIVRNEAGLRAYSMFKKDLVIEDHDYQLDKLNIVQAHQKIRINAGSTRRFTLRLLGKSVTRFYDFKSFNKFKIQHIYIIIRSFLGTIYRSLIKRSC